MKSGPKPDLNAIHVIQLKQIFAILAQLFKNPTIIEQAYSIFDLVDQRVQLRSKLLKKEEVIDNGSIIVLKPGANSPFVSVMVTKFLREDPILDEIKKAVISDDNAVLDSLIVKLLSQDKSFINRVLINEADLVYEIGNASGENQNNLFNRLRRNHSHGIDILTKYYSEEFLQRLIQQDNDIKKNRITRIHACMGSERVSLYRNLRDNHIDGLVSLDEDFLKELEEEKNQLNIIEKIRTRQGYEQNQKFIELRDRHEGGLEFLVAELGEAFLNRLIEQSKSLKEKREQLIRDMGFCDNPESELVANFSAVTIEKVLDPYQKPLVPAFEQLKIEEAPIPRIAQGRRNSCLPSELPNQRPLNRMGE